MLDLRPHSPVDFPSQEVVDWLLARLFWPNFVAGALVTFLLGFIHR